MSIFESVKADQIVTKERRQEVLSALRTELQQIQTHLEKQHSWLTQLRNQLSLNSYTRFFHIPFPRAIYDGHLSTIYTLLKEEELRLLHLLYTYLSILDSTLTNFDSIAEESKKSYAPYQPYGGVLRRVDDLQLTGQKARDIISHHLTGSPLQYVHIETHLA